jgi:hypothetical protein
VKAESKCAPLGAWRLPLLLLVLTNSSLTSSAYNFTGQFLGAVKDPDPDQRRQLLYIIVSIGPQLQDFGVDRMDARNKEAR